MSAEGSTDSAEQICRVDPELMKQGGVLFGVDQFWQLLLRTVGHLVLASAAELVDDLLPFDLHPKHPFRRELSVVQPA